MKLLFYNALFTCLLITGTCLAQSPAQTDQLKKSVVKLEGIQMRYSYAEISKEVSKRIDTIPNVTSAKIAEVRDMFATALDTIRGTAVLISDGPKMYLVTAKHLVIAKELLNGKEDINRLGYGKVNINGTLSHDINFIAFSGLFTKMPPVAFSNDKDDLAILSFNQSSFKAYADYLTQIGTLPIPLYNIATADDVNKGDELFTVGYPALSSTDHGIAISNGKAGANDKSSTTFTANMSVRPGNSGAPVFKNDKLVGIISYQSGIKSNVDVTEKPTAKASSATVIKSSVILSLLRELQGKEGK